MTNNFTRDQIYLFYEKVKKEELEKNRLNAMIMAHSFMYATPAYDKKDASKKSQQWKKFLDSFDWNKITTKDKKKITVKGLQTMMMGLGVPIVKKDVSK